MRDLQRNHKHFLILSLGFPLPIRVSLTCTAVHQALPSLDGESLEKTYFVPLQVLMNIKHVWYIRIKTSSVPLQSDVY